MSRRSDRRRAQREEAQRIAAAAPSSPDRAVVMPAPSIRRDRAVDEAERSAKSAQAFVAVLKEADVGQTRRIIDLGKSSRARDSRLDGVSAMRVLVIASRRFTIKPATGHEADPLHRRRIASATALLKQRRVAFDKQRQHLATATLEPHAVLEHDWHVTTINTVVDGVSYTESLWNTAPQWRHPRRFVWNDDAKIAKCDVGSDPYDGIPLENYPGKFIVHTPVAGSSDYPWKRGALRSRLAGSIGKRMGVTWWLSAVERYGQPQLAVVLDTGDANLVRAAMTSLRNIGPDWRAILPKGVDIKTLDATVSPDLHQRFVDWQNTEDAIRILGQNLSTEVKGGSYAAAVSQERVRADILAGDLAELDETINDQWISLLWQYNWPGEPVGVLETQIANATPWTIADYQAGLCTADEYRLDNGKDPEADGKGARYYAAPVAPAAAMPAGGADAVSPFSQQASMTPTASASPTSSTSPSTTHPLRSALSRL